MTETHTVSKEKIRQAPSGSGAPEVEESNDDTVVTSRYLSRLAETADGTRDEDLALVKNPKGLLEIRPAPTPERPLPSGYEFIAHVRTKGSCTREKVTSVTIETENYGKQPAITGQGPDAVFWTESAVEKFLYPYYHSQRLWDENMDKLRAQFATDTKAYGMLHRAPSNSTVLSASQTLKIARITEAEGEPATLKWLGVKEYLEQAGANPSP
jgi:hypothetical protein